MFTFPFYKEGQQYTAGSLPELSCRQKVFLGILEKETLQFGKAMATAELIGMTKEELSELFDHCLMTRRGNGLIASGKLYHPNWKLQL